MYFHIKPFFNFQPMCQITNFAVLPFKMGNMRETFAAILTRVELSLGVDPQVHRQVRLLVELFVAGRAAKVALEVVVPPYMIPQDGQSPKLFVASAALERMLRRRGRIVDGVLMSHQRCPPAKLFVALVAFELL